MNKFDSSNDKWLSFKSIYHHNKQPGIRRWFYILAGLGICILFLPWTQSVRSTGFVTSLKQEQRPQELNTVIAGKVIRWYVNEGDYVKAGDTILQLAEIKDDYLDPQLINRTNEQLLAKQQTISLYRDKANTSSSQINAMAEASGLKVSQLRNKLQQLSLQVNSAENELSASENELEIAEKQFQRQRAMYDSGFVSLTQLEQRNQSYRNALAKKVNSANKLTNLRQDIANTRLEINAIGQEYAEKIAKAQGDQFQSLSEIARGTGDIAKLENQVSNYEIRNGLYNITAPQSGQVTRAMKAGIGEIVKEGEMVVQIVPDKVDYAVELFVRPMDLPLIKKNQKVRFMFDGFPAIVFSGWPKGSFGTFGGRISAVETAVSPNGKFRILVTADENAGPWPPQLSMGSGAIGMALLNEVPIWYELWRSINGFPPDFYKASASSKDKKSQEK